MGTGHEYEGGTDFAGFRATANELMETIAAKHRVTPHVSRLAAVLARSRQLIAIPGTSNVDHLQANMTAFRLSEEEDFRSAWLHQGGIPHSQTLRGKRERDELKRRLSEPGQTIRWRIFQIGGSPTLRKHSKRPVPGLATMLGRPGARSP